MLSIDQYISELLKIEPFWKICHPCCFHGYCCKGAKVSFTDWEALITKIFVSTLSAEEKNIIRDNEQNKRSCVFQAPDRCLIHPVRPANCRYTPYQFVITPKNVLKYSMVRIGASGHCEFKYVERQLSECEAVQAKTLKFQLLPNFDRQTYYVSLNWFLSQEKHPQS